MNAEPQSYTPEACIRNFAAVLQYVRIYTVTHHLSREKMKGLHTYLQEYFRRSRTDDFVFGLIMGELVSGKEVLIESSKLLKAFIALLEQRRIEKISIDRQTSLAELALFIELLGDTKTYPLEKPIGELLAACNITRIKTGILSTEEMNAPETTPGNDSSGTYLRQYYASLIPAVTELIQKVYNRSADDKDATMFIELVHELMAHMDDDPEGLFSILGYLRIRNEYEYVHSTHVAILTLIQARSLSLGKKIVSEIGMAGFLHDVGKLSIPLEILNKPTVLNTEELQLMKQHPSCGAQILVQYVPIFGELPVIVSFQHHLTYSGTGYPERLTYAKELSLASRMTTIADVYDALRSNRSYRPGMPPEKVYTLMRSEQGTSFDPFLLDNFFSIMGIWPPGTIVELTDNRIGVVQSENTFFLDKPVVEVFFDNPAGEPIVPYKIDLEKEDAVRIQHSLGTEKLAEKHITVPDQYRV